MSPEESEQMETEKAKQASSSVSGWAKSRTVFVCISSRNIRFVERITMNLARVSRI